MTEICNSEIKTYNIHTTNVQVGVTSICVTSDQRIVLILAHYLHSFIVLSYSSANISMCPLLYSNPFYVSFHNRLYMCCTSPWWFISCCIGHDRCTSPLCQHTAANVHSMFNMLPTRLHSAAILSSTPQTSDAMTAWCTPSLENHSSKKHFKLQLSIFLSCPDNWKQKVCW